MQNDKQSLFEIYKLHSDLAERMANAREGSNKLYAGMITTIVAVSTLVNQIFPHSGYELALPILGLMVSLSWLLTLNTATGKLQAKHNILVELEQQLDFPFFAKENQAFQNGRMYIRTKYTTMVMPLCFFTLCVCLILLNFGIMDL